jgi:hypothetical protein
LKGWSRRFDDPIILPNGRKLVTLRHAGEYIAALPAKEQKEEGWERAARALMLVVESGGPTMLARIGIMQALNPSGNGPAEPRQKRVKKYRL